MNKAAKCTDYPARFQFEASSGTLYRSQVWNCGMTGAAQQVDYYKGRPGTTHIEYQRTVAGIEHSRPTNAWEQALVLERHGIPCRVVEIESMGQLDELVGYGHRPVGIGVLMSRISAYTRGHTFLGWHRLTLLSRKAKTFNGKRVRGYVYTDPNFNPVYRPDPLKGHRWISRRALRYAFLDNDPSYAIVPLNKKVS